MKGGKWRRGGGDEKREGEGIWIWDLVADLKAHRTPGEGARAYRLVKGGKWTAACAPENCAEAAEQNVAQSLFFGAGGLEAPSPRGRRRAAQWNSGQEGHTLFRVAAGQGEEGAQLIPPGRTAPRRSPRRSRRCRGPPAASRRARRPRRRGWRPRASGTRGGRTLRRCGAPTDARVTGGGGGGLRARPHPTAPPPHPWTPSPCGALYGPGGTPAVALRRPPPPPVCDIPSRCCLFTGPWTVTRSPLRMSRRVAAFRRPLRPVLLRASFLTPAPPPPPHTHVPHPSGRVCVCVCVCVTVPPPVPPRGPATRLERLARGPVICGGAVSLRDLCGRRLDACERFSSGLGWALMISGRPGGASTAVWRCSLGLPKPCDLRCTARGERGGGGIGGGLSKGVAAPPVDVPRVAASQGLRQCTHRTHHFKTAWEGGALWISVRETPPASAHRARADCVANGG